MIFRVATLKDVPQIQIVRNSVKENRLSDPSLITDKDCEEYLLHKGKGWVCEIENIIVAFSIADLDGNNIWALFVRPEYESKQIGSTLHDLMLTWYFSQTTKTVWLSTAPKSKAELFYRKAGWKETGIYGKGEIKFEMSYHQWLQIK